MEVKTSSIYKILFRLSYLFSFNLAVHAILLRIKTDQSLAFLVILIWCLPLEFYFRWPFKKFCPGHKVLILNSPFTLVISFILFKRISFFITIAREIILVNIRSGMTKEFRQPRFCLNFRNVYLTFFTLEIILYEHFFHYHFKKLNFLFLISSRWFI